MLVAGYILFSHYGGRKPVEKFYLPLVLVSILWAFGMLLVTSFSYQGFPARPFWNNPLMGTRFPASAFVAGPALITFVLVVLQSTTTFKFDDQVFNKIRRIVLIE